MNKVTLVVRWPTVEDAQQDAERVASLIRHQSSVQSMPIRVQTYQREEKLGGGFGYILTCGPVSIVCRSITRYTACYSLPEGPRGNHRDEFEAVTAEDAIQEMRDFLEERIKHARLALAVLSGPAA
ncbi:hypothetical protein [Phage ST231]|nr:hypothetical protein [Phage ST231]